MPEKQPNGDLALLAECVTDYIRQLRQQGHNTAATVVQANAQGSINRLSQALDSPPPPPDKPEDDNAGD